MTSTARTQEEPLRVSWIGVQGPIPVSRWGKDHYSTLLYIESRCVDQSGKLPPNDPRMRADGHGYPTRLSDNTVVDGHSDWECLTDMTALGLVVYDEEQGQIEPTDTGFALAHETRIRKARTGRMLP